MEPRGWELLDTFGIISNSNRLFHHRHYRYTTFSGMVLKCSLLTSPLMNGPFSANVFFSKTNCCIHKLWFLCWIGSRMKRKFDSDRMLIYIFNEETYPAIFPVQEGQCVWKNLHLLDKFWLLYGQTFSKCLRSGLGNQSQGCDNTAWMRLMIPAWPFVNLDGNFPEQPILKRLNTTWKFPQTTVGKYKLATSSFSVIHTHASPFITKYWEEF